MSGRCMHAIDALNAKADPKVGSHKKICLGASAKNRVLYLCDCTGYLDSTRAGFGAVEGGTAAPDTFLVVQDVQAKLGLVVAAVEDEAVSVHDSCWTKVLTVCPEHWARGGAGCAKNALGGVIEACAVFGAL